MAVMVSDREVNPAAGRSREHLVITGLQARCPDRILGIAVLRLEFATPPRQVLGAGCVAI